MKLFDFTRKKKYNITTFYDVLNVPYFGHVYGLAYGRVVHSNSYVHTSIYGTDANIDKCCIWYMYKNGEPILIDNKSDVSRAVLEYLENSYNNFLIKQPEVFYA